MREAQRKAVLHLQQRTAMTETAIAHWLDTSKKFAKLCACDGDKSILDRYREDAVDAYEALLDTVVCERTALTMLEGIQKSAGRPEDNA